MALLLFGFWVSFLDSFGSCAWGGWSFLFILVFFCLYVPHFVPSLLPILCSIPPHALISEGVGCVVSRDILDTSKVLGLADTHTFESGLLIVYPY
jgi:hypothetical protein